MINKLLLSCFILICGAAGKLQAQGANGKPTSGIQPKLMVMPRVTDNENVKTLYDGSMNLQIGIAKINEAFEKRGANIKTFTQAMKQEQQNELLNKTAGNQQDYKAKVIAESGADITIEIKLDVVDHPERHAKSVNLILEAFQAGTSNLLASKTVAGNMAQTEDVGQLTMIAIDKIADDFLAIMQSSFDGMRENGQSMFVEFSLGKDAAVTFDSEVKGQLLSAAITDWFDKNSVNGQYNSQGTSENKMIFSDVKLPLKKRNNANANYTAETFFGEIYAYMKTLGLNCKRLVGSNNRIIITIL